MTLFLIVWIASGAYAAGLLTRDANAKAVYEERRERWGLAKTVAFYIGFVIPLTFATGPMMVIAAFMFPPDHPSDLCRRCWLRPKRHGRHDCKRCSDKQAEKYSDSDGGGTGRTATQR